MVVVIEPFAISPAVTAQEQVVGAGPIGLGVAAIAAAAGTQVVVVDSSEQRRAHVAQQLRLATINPLAGDYCLRDRYI